MGIRRNLNDEKQSLPSVIPNGMAAAMGQGGSEHCWQLLFDNLRASIFYLDQWACMCTWNSSAAALFQSNDLYGKTLLELLDGWGNSLQFNQEVRDILRRGEPLYGVIEYVTDGDSERWFRVDKVPVYEDGNISGVLVMLDDITALKLNERYLRKSDDRYKAFVKNNLDALWRFEFTPGIPLTWPVDRIIATIDERAVLVDCNRVFARILGHQSETHLVGLSLGDIDAEHVIIDLEAFTTHHFQLLDHECNWVNRLDREYFLQNTLSGTVENNELVEMWGLTRDNTERKRHIETLQHQAIHDQLTGLPNRVKLTSAATEMLATRDMAQKMALLVVDLDRFKEINDTIGHHIGDKVVQEIGPRLQRELSEYDAVIARLGGDEFGIFIANIEDLAQIQSMTQQILSCIRRDIQIGDLHIEVRASIGVALCPQQAEDFTTLLRYAEVAMYHAKEEMTAVEIYDAAYDPHSQKRLLLMSELGKAIRNNQLILHYQPKISMQTGDVVCVEALARWFHPTMGFISPGEFVPIAEMTDSINEMTYWVLNESLGQVKRWRDEGLCWSVAVNISAKNLLNDNITQKITELLDNYQLPASCLELEITESTIMANPNRSLRILEEINALGVILSIDDFGTGYSSLAYIKKLPVHYLKIDYSFVVNMLEDQQDFIIVNSTINLAHNLGLRVVAEGVESEQVLYNLAAMQCEQAQGYHIAKPMPAEELPAWLSNSKWSLATKS